MVELYPHPPPPILQKLRNSLNAAMFPKLIYLQNCFKNFYWIFMQENADGFFFFKTVSIFFNDSFFLEKDYLVWCRIM